MTRLGAWLSGRTGGAPLTPLAVLFALNLVDELDQAAFGLLAPEIRDTFDLSEERFTLLATAAGALVIMLIVPVGVLADRTKRVRLLTVAALAWSVMSVLTGVAGVGGGVLVLLVASRFGAGLGRVMNEPVHASLLADYYPPATHARVYSLHRLANPLGLLLAFASGAIALAVGWQLTFVVLAVPTLVIIVLVARLAEPARGASADAALAAAAEERQEKIPFGEAFRRLSGIPTLKRSWAAGFLLGAAVLPIATFLSFFYEKVYGFDSLGRGWVITVFGLGSLLGLLHGGRLADTIIGSGRLAGLAATGGLTLVGFGLSLLLAALSPWVAGSLFFTFLAGATGVGFQAFHLPLVAIVAPPRLRSQAFAWFGGFFGVGAILLAPFATGIGEDSGYRWGIGVLAVLVVVSGAIYLSARRFVQRDAEQAFLTLATESGMRLDAGEGEPALLSCRGVEAAYDSVQVLFGVDLEVRRGEVVALLGTNGAGKSTLLRAISGTMDPIGGAIFLSGRDITHADAGQTARLGIVQVPGGRAVFPTLTVAEHLRAAGWLFRDDPEYLKAATEDVLVTFPRLRDRFEQQAGNLSGGEQQMLALGMAFIAKPTLLMIDELSLGLAPTIVEQLLGIVRRIRDGGTAIVLVEQSINVALTVAERAYFMEKGEVRFEGPTSELLERDDIVRAVFLTGSATAPPVEHAAPRPAPVADAAPVLELRGVVKRFGGITAVDGTTLTLHEGEVLGLIGPNGAGKTTIFDLVSGFLTPDEGRISFAGVDITGMAPDRRAWLGLGRSFQDARLVPSLTVAENIALGLERHLALRDHLAAGLALPSMQRQEQDVAWTVQDLIELMGLGAYRSKFARELSTGSRRIVDLAMCLAHEPRVLLLDEPSSGIAQRETEALGPLLRRIQAETGCSLLVIEHDMPLITSVSDRLIALEVGHPIAEGTPEEVVHDPRVVASYLGGDMAAVNRSGPSRNGDGNGNGNGSTSGRRRRAPLVAAGRGGP